MAKAIREGEVKIGSLTIKVNVLDDGQRVIEEQGVLDFMKFLEAGEFTQEQASKFAIDLNSI